MGRRYKLLILIALTCLLICIGIIAFNTQVSHAASPQQLKAAFLVNFIKLTKWPLDFATLEIGIYKDAKFSDLLTKLLAGKKIQGKNVTVKLQEDAALFANCHVVFVPKSAEGELGDVFTKIKALGDTPPKLTVGEEDPFIDAGGMIAFVPAGAKIKFKVNLGPAKAKKFSISAKLLKLALDVKQ